MVPEKIHNSAREYEGPLLESSGSKSGFNIAGTIMRASGNSGTTRSLQSVFLAQRVLAG
jgi:hypothetical protein